MTNVRNAMRNELYTTKGSNYKKNKKTEGQDWLLNSYQERCAAENGTNSLEGCWIFKSSTCGRKREIEREG